MEIWNSVRAMGRKVAEGAAHVAKIGKTQALALTVAGMLALPSIAAFAEDANGTGTTASQFAQAQSTAESQLQVTDLAKCAYEVATKNISTTVVYIVLLAAVGLAIAWVLKIFRFGKRG